MSEDELGRTIARLSADYAAQLPGTVAQMEELWRRIVAAELPLSQLSELLRTAHSISGSGATFGLPGASEAAGELELFMERLIDSGRPPGPAEHEVARALLAAIRQAAAQC
ncbi:MAG: Hpt domain-containing protein [Burkholderiales bacterium]|nr:Hpt domain-containing protein [Burkholderiales bacterium]